MLKFLFICTALFFFANEAVGFQCYTPQANGNITEKDCEEGIEHCVKEQKIEEGPILRDCGMPTDKKEMGCKYHVDKEYIYRCFCDTELCNSAHRHFVKASLILLLICMQFV